MKIRIPRKLKKRYKKMGIWSAYLNIPVMDEDEFREFLLFSRGCKPLIIKLLRNHKRNES